MTDKIGTADCPLVSEMLCDYGTCPACDAAADAYNAYLIQEEEAEKHRPPYAPNDDPAAPPF